MRLVQGFQADEGRGDEPAILQYTNIDEGKLPEKKFAATIKDTIGAYDVVLLQDSVGRHGTPAAKKLAGYYKAIDAVYEG